MAQIVLKGTTWAHLRGVAPIAAASQAWADQHPGISVVWETHSARQFGEGPVEALAERYDLVCFDHPQTGHAAATGCFLPFDEFLPAAYLLDLSMHSTGASFRSYAFEGHQWGLPIDAATIVMAARRDSLDRIGVHVPETWSGLLELGREPGCVAQGFSRATTTAIFFSLCANLGRPALHETAPWLPANIGQEVLLMLQRLFDIAGGPERLAHGSIQVLAEAARPGSTIACVPFTFGYSTHARRDFAPVTLEFSPIVAAGNDRGVGGVLGGVGIGVSSHSQQRTLALELARWLASPECQRGIYSTCAGQPADRRAWEDDWPNQITNGFYRRLLPAMERSWLRPNTEAFHGFQVEAATLLHAFLQHPSSLKDTWRELDRAAKRIKTPAGLTVPDVHLAT